MELGRVRVEHTNGGSVVLTHFFSSWFMTDDRIDGIAVYLERTSMNISNLSNGRLTPCDALST